MKSPQLFTNERLRFFYLGHQYPYGVIREAWLNKAGAFRMQVLV